MMKHKIFIIFMIFFFLLPPVLLCIYAFSQNWPYPQLLPSSLSLHSFNYIISQNHAIIVALGSSFLYSFTAVILTLTISLLPARLFAWHKFRGRIILESLLITPALLPAMLFAMGAHYTFLKAGITDSFAGVVLILTTVSYPYMLRALTAGFIACGENLTVCSSNLGAGPVRTFISVELPIIFPSIAAGGSIVFLVSFSEYFLVFLIGGGIIPSYSGYLFPFLNSSEHSISSLLTLIFLIIPMILFFAIDILLRLYYRKKFML